MSPGFMAATAFSATAPMQSSTNFTGRLTMCATSAATGLSESFGSRLPLGRPKCESRMTLAPASASSVMAGATRSMRVASVTTPCSSGTLRSTRTSTRLPFTSTWSRVRKFAMQSVSSRSRRSTLVMRYRPGPQLQEPGSRISGAPLTRCTASGTRDVKSTSPSPRRCRPCGWRSPIRCRTTTASRAPACRPSPWSAPCRRPRNGGRG